MAFCRPLRGESLPREPERSGAEPQNLMPVGGNYANGCLSSGKNFYSRADLRSRTAGGSR